MAGWVNRTIADADLDAFVDNLVNRIASFDKKLIATIKSIINERAVNSKNEHLMETQTRFFATLAEPVINTSKS